MKKFIPMFVFTGFFFGIIPLTASDCLNVIPKSSQNDRQELKDDGKKVSAKDNKAAKELKAKEQKKRDIEAKEHSVNKNKPAKRFSTDENIPETVRKRNIP